MSSARTVLRGLLSTPPGQADRFAAAARTVAVAARARAVAAIVLADGGHALTLSEAIALRVLLCFGFLWFSFSCFFLSSPILVVRRMLSAVLGLVVQRRGMSSFFFFLWSFFRNEKRRRIAKFEQKKRKEKKKRVKEEVDRGNYLLPTYLLPCWAALLLLAVVGVVPQVVLSYRCDLKS